MAMICRSGASECDGCMSCQEQIAVYTCAGCGEEIYEGEDYYKIIPASPRPPPNAATWQGRSR